MARKVQKTDNLTGYDYTCPLFNLKTFECAVTLDGCRRYDAERKVSPDGNCKVRVEMLEEYYKQLAQGKVEDYEEIYVKGQRQEGTTGKVEEEIEFV